MGSLTGNPNAIAAFTGQTYPNGLDLARCQINNELGIWAADPLATFLQGQLVDKGANGITAVSSNTNVLGIAKWNKTTTLYGVQVDEPLVLKGVAGGAQALKFANVSNVSVRLAAGVNTAVVANVAGADYVLNATNGTILPVALGALIANPMTVYVTYTYQLTAAQLDQQGRNFWNFVDDVTIQAGAITVITGPAVIFTTQYDTSAVFTVTGIGANVYSTSGGLFTSVAGGGVLLGSVIQIPTATDPYLGIQYYGPVGARS